MSDVLVLSKKQIDEAFAEGAKDRHQATVLLRLYRLVGIDLEKVKSVSGYPRAGKEVSQYITRRFIEFDQVYHPNVLAGGLWALGKGFSSSDDIGEWEVDISHLTIEMEEEHAAGS